MLNLDSEAGVKLVGEPLTMAMGRVALVAEQAKRPAGSRQRRFGKRGQLIKFVLRVRRREMALENAQHLIGVTAARCQPPFFRGAQLLQMHIADAVLIEPGGELAFRKPGPPRRRDSSHVDQETGPSLRQRIEERARGRLLVADGENGFHDIRSIKAKIAPRD